MPTGYTAKLCEGEQPFSEFALSCARAFGACVMQRDDSISDAPKLREQSSYYATALEESKQALSKLKKMSQERREAFGRKEIADQILRCNQMVAERRVIAARIKKMIADTERWMPPTQEHHSLKTFMLDQLQRTLDHDGDASYYENDKARLLAMDPIEMYNQHLERAAWNVQYHAEQLVKEESRVSSSNEWITQLYESLGVEFK